MLQNKDIANLREVSTFFTKRWLQPMFFSEQLKLFRFSKTNKILSSIKKKVVLLFGIFLNLLLVFAIHGGIKIYTHLYTTRITPNISTQKDVYYRLLANQNINWRSYEHKTIKQAFIT